MFFLSVRRTADRVTESATAENSEEEYVDDTEEVDGGSSVTSSDESALKEDDADDVVMEVTFLTAEGIRALKMASLLFSLLTERPSYTSCSPPLAMT